MMPRRNIFILFVTGILLASCQKRDCDGFDIVGVWRLDQETYSDGYVNTNTLNRYKIFYKDNTFICLRIFLNEHDTLPPDCETHLTVNVPAANTLDCKMDYCADLQPVV